MRARLRVRRGRHVLEELLRAAVHFLAREVFLVCGNRPLESEWIGEGSAAIAPELIHHLAHRAWRHPGAGADRTVEDRIAILNVYPERNGRPARRLGTR